MIGNFDSAEQIAKNIRSGNVSAYEAVEAAINRIEAFDKHINAVVVRDFEVALKSAREADNSIFQGLKLGPLHGVPVTIKEAFDLKNHPTTWGLKKFEHNIATRDALVVEKLKEAGAIFLGKTNVPRMLSDWQTYNEIYGTTNNPWDLNRSPGGSSGGAAAALAAGFVSLEVGSDIGGSIRGPAHYCGVYGHKPSYGIIPMDGHTLPNIKIDLDLIVGGPIARKASDLRLAINIIKGPTREHMSAWQITLPEQKKSSLADYRVAVCLNQSICKVDKLIIDRMEEIAKFLDKNGAAISFDAMPNIELNEIHDLYLKNLRGATGALMDDAEFTDAINETSKLTPDDVSYWAYVNRSATQTHRDYFTIKQKRQKINNEWAKFFDKWDILLCPTTASTAIIHNQDQPRHKRTILVNNKKESYNDQLFWAGLAIFSHLPATVFPTGVSENGLPIGIQAIGPYLGDLKTIQFAELMEATYGGFSPPISYI